MADPQILVPRAYTRAERADTNAARVGPGSGHLAGGHILDLAAIGSMILLCDFCDPKFVPKGVGYVRWHPEGPCTGFCDGCRQHSNYAHAFIPETLESAVGVYGRGRNRARRGRWSR